jgi:hypothetical protein
MNAMTQRKKKSLSSATSDRHLSNRMARIPEDLYQLMKQVAAEHRRPLTWEIQVALEAYLKGLGKLPSSEPKGS